VLPVSVPCASSTVLQMKPLSILPEPNIKTPSPSYGSPQLIFISSPPHVITIPSTDPLPIRANAISRASQERRKTATYSVSFPPFRSILLFCTSALMTSAASECVRASTSWNSPSFSSALASSSPWGGSRDREVGAGVAIFVRFR